MNRNDAVNLIGSADNSDNDYVPVACLLASGYGCYGYFNRSVNEKLQDTLVLLNAQLVDLRTEEGHSRYGRASDFNDFLQDVVTRHVNARYSGDVDDSDEEAEDTIPLTAIPLREISILYPVSHIATLLKTAHRVTSGDRPKDATEVPTFLDFNNKSVVLKVLRTQLW